MDSSALVSELVTLRTCSDGASFSAVAALAGGDSTTGSDRASSLLLLLTIAISSTVTVGSSSWEGAGPEPEEDIEVVDVSSVNCALIGDVSSIGGSGVGTATIGSTVVVIAVVCATMATTSTGFSAAC